MTRTSYRPEFAQLLKQAREDCGLSTRQLGRVLGFSHSQVVRTSSDARFPRWPRVSEYLNGCGVGGDVLYAWWQLWSTTRSVEQELRLPPRTAQDRQWYWATMERHWQQGLRAISKPDPMLITLRSVATLEELGTALHALVTRAGLDSIRQVEALTGIPKTTLHHWFSGTRKPTPERLQTLVVAADATNAECREFHQAIDRLGAATCATRMEQTRHRCVLGELHKGPHRAANGELWLDDGELDGARGPRQWLIQRTAQSAGPHW